jgi:hypothetical protein
MAQYFSGYRDQFHAVTVKIKAAIDSLLTVRADDPPVIIIQGDHGPGSGLNWNSADSTDMWERSSILNSIFCPGKDIYFYPGISPVNTFRCIFNAYFGTDLDLLPDRVFYSTWDRPFQFKKVSTNPPDSLVEDSRIDDLRPLQNSIEVSTQ